MLKEIKNPQELLDIVSAFRISRIVLTAYELGIFTELSEKPVMSDELAVKLQCDPRALDRLMNALVSIGLLLKEAGVFMNTPFSVRFLVKGSPAYMAGLMHQVHLWRTWSTLTEAVKAGTSVAVEQPIGERDDEWLESFIAAMHSRAVPQSKEIADLLQLSKTKSLLDVGGGSGAFAFEFVKRNEGMQAVVFDLPSVIPITRKYIEKSGLTHRVTPLEGDYLLHDFGGKYDMVFVSAVIHINSPEENLYLIRKCVDALNPGGQLVILDHIMNEERTEPVMGAIFALNMLVGTLHGDTYTDKEIRSWMLDAGLKEISRKETVQGTNLMIGIK